MYQSRLAVASETTSIWVTALAAKWSITADGRGVARVLTTRPD